MPEPFDDQTRACRWDGEAWPCYPVLKAQADALAAGCIEHLAVMDRCRLCGAWWAPGLPEEFIQHSPATCALAAYTKAITP